MGVWREGPMTARVTKALGFLVHREGIGRKRGIYRGILKRKRTLASKFQIYGWKGKILFPMEEEELPEHANILVAEL